MGNPNPDNQKSMFWKAAIFTLFIFLLGVLLGYGLESRRISAVEREHKQIEIEWADAKLQSIYYQMIEPEFCEIAIDENIRFADKIYEQGLKLEKYEEANQLTERLLFEKKREALLKVEFWLNSISLKERCEASYKNLVYFYANEPNTKQKVEQKTQSIILENIKEKYGPDVMLIPLPIGLDISIINIMKETHKITKIPAILIDETTKLEGLQSAEDIEKILKI